MTQDGVVVELFEPNLVVVRLAAGRDLTMESVVPFTEWISSVFVNGKHAFLNILEYGSTIDPEVREYMSSNTRLSTVEKDAFIVNSLAHKLVANFYKNFHKPAVPTEFFSNKEDALKWLSSSGK